MFQSSQDATITARGEGERARDYFNGHQLTATEKATLQKRKQPPIVNNRVRRKVEWLKGLEIKQRTDPKAFPRTPKHVDDAESITDALRFVCDDQNWDNTRSSVYDDFLVEGFGGVEVVHQETKRGIDIRINHYPWDRLFYDPYSRRHDFSDARYLGAVVWMDFEDFKEAYPDEAENVDTLASHAESDSDTYDDRPDDIWVDAKRKRIRLILIWFLSKGVWKYARFIKGSIIEQGESPYQDEDGESVCPLILQSAYVDRDNARYGVVRDMFDIQDEINKRRSKLLHELNNRQTMGVKGAVNSVSAMKREVASPDGHIEIHPEAFEDAARLGIKPFEFISRQDQVQGQFALLNEAKQEIDLHGANAALAGETGESASGRAVMARQQGGMIEIASLNDRMHHFTQRVFEAIWLRIRQFWTEEKWVRITDDDRNVRFVGLNRPITLEEKLSQAEPQEAQMVAMQLGLVPGDPRLGMVVEIQNEVSKIDVDIIIEEAPDRITLEGEVFEALLKYGPTIPPAVLFEADPSLPAKKKEKLLEMMQQPPQPSPSEQLDLAAKKAEVDETAAKTGKLQAETIQTQVETRLSAYSPVSRLAI